MTENNSARPVVVSYTPKILRNMAEICEEMGVGEKTVKKWVKQGAPVAVEGDGRRVRYSAEVARLQAWRETSL
ncbi:MAG: MerR family transcriptional regulator [Desulfovibrio sp.]|uniref:MerR family transcriptional regulator n=1 Tax=Desulfovibrio sp. TaxID=885 RepID=UPI00258EFA56|nr:MerR family transcriptional regulator [Desulfovibrio sp.]MCD7984148.1 MerR family transcriptional regulator [Desulfovibrio sp.]